MRLVTSTVPALLAVPGLVHGFERRGEDAGRSETRDEARARVRAALRDRGRLQLLTQVHGCRVVAAPAPGRPEADAALTTRAGVLLGIETADCLPVLLVDPRRRAVAAAHAGWRGTAAGISTAVVQSLVDDGSRPADLLAALGPAIGPCCYEVGEELRDAFGPLADAVFRSGPRGRPHLDVREANLRQLLQAGLRPERVEHVAECTRCMPGRYHSYRRDGRGAGRMISFVGFSA
jgi:hypothetical protein